MKIKKFIPSSLLGRSLIIVFVPTISVVLLTSLVFYETSWNIVSKRLTQSVAADIKVVIKLIDHGLKFKAFRTGTICAPFVIVDIIDGLNASEICLT